jgi:hypothetical protein
MSQSGARTAFAKTGVQTDRQDFIAGTIDARTGAHSVTALAGASRRNREQERQA